MAQHHPIVHPPRTHARRRGFAALAAALTLSTLGAQAAARADSGQLQITVMTHNLFQGL